MHIRWSRIYAVVSKELRETIRDKRSLLSMLVLPVFIFPIAFLGLILLGERGLDFSADREFTFGVTNITSAPELVKFLAREDDIRVFELSNFHMAIRRGLIDVGLVVPPGFSDDIKLGNSTSISIMFDNSKAPSVEAYERAAELIAGYEETVIGERLIRLNLSPSVASPFETTSIDITLPREREGVSARLVLPYVIILLALMGAMYPAVDMTAGEKERRTIESLLASNAKREEIALGKWLAVSASSLVTSIISVVSLSTTFYLANVLSESGRQVGLVLDWFNMILAILMLVPLILAISSGLLCVCLFAKSYKEAHTYVTPALLLIILPAAVAIVPGTSLTLGATLTPVVNVSLAMKETLMGRYDFVRLGVVFLAMSFYAVIVTFLAVRLFRREDLFV
jgi:sodium transport system permease protein